MVEIVESLTPVLSVKAMLSYDLTELLPPAHDQLVDHFTTPEVTEVRVRLCDPDVAAEAPQRFW